MKKRLLFPLLGTLLTVSLLSQDFSLVPPTNIVYNQNELMEVVEDLNNEAIKLGDTRFVNDEVDASQVFVQYGLLSENEYCIRFAVAIKNVNSISFTRHVDGVEDKVKQVENVYKAISAEGKTYYYDGNGLVEENLDNGYYFACYTIMLSKDSVYLEKPFTITPTINNETKASLSVSLNTLKANNLATASFYDGEELIGRTIVEKGEVVEYFGNEYKGEQRIGSWTKGEKTTEWLGRLSEDTSFVANYYDVVRLSTQEDLLALDAAVRSGETSNKYYIQTANLDVTTMIGEEGLPFEGVLDGNGFTFNLNISRENENASFIAKSKGLLKNVHTTGSVTSTKKWVAGITSKNYGYIIDSVNEAIVHSDVAEIGGVACYNYNTIYNTTNRGQVDGTYTVGGIVGFNIYDATVNENPIILSCYNEGKVYSHAYESNTSATSTTAGFWVGGIVGTNHLDVNSSKYLTIENCVNKAEVRGAGGIRSTNANNRNYAGVGGIIGANWQATIKNCENIGDVRGYHYFGGIVGTTGGVITGCTNRGFVNSNTETSSNISSYQGGIVGFTVLGLLENNNNYGDVRGYQIFGGVLGCFGVATENVIMTNCNNYGDVYTTAGSNGSSHSIGGVVGYLGAYHTLIDCDNEGEVKGIGNYTSKEGVGGIVGTVYNNVNINQCDNTGDITAVRTTGGIVGAVLGTDVNVDTCTNDCAFLSRSTNNQVIIGGIFGHTSKTGLQITNCSSVIEVSFESTTLVEARYVGLIGGFATAGTSPIITNSNGVINNSVFASNLPNVGTSTSLTIVR